MKNKSSPSCSICENGINHKRSPVARDLKQSKWFCRVFKGRIAYPRPSRNNTNQKERRGMSLWLSGSGSIGQRSAHKGEAPHPRSSWMLPSSQVSFRDKNHFSCRTSNSHACLKFCQATSFKCEPGCTVGLAPLAISRVALKGHFFPPNEDLLYRKEPSHFN